MKLFNRSKQEIDDDFLLSWRKSHCNDLGEWYFDTKPYLYKPGQIHPSIVYNELKASQPLTKDKITEILQRASYSEDERYIDQSMDKLTECTECGAKVEYLASYNNDEDFSYQLICVDCLKKAIKKIEEASI